MCAESGTTFAKSNVEEMCLAPMVKFPLSMNSKFVLRTKTRKSTKVLAIETLIFQSTNLCLCLLSLFL